MTIKTKFDYIIGCPEDQEHTPHLVDAEENVGGFRIGVVHLHGTPKSTRRGLASPPTRGPLGTRLNDLEGASLSSKIRVGI